VAKKHPKKTSNVAKVEASNMTQNEHLEYDAFSNMLVNENIVVDAADIHGILCGMLAGGMNIDDQEWLEALADVVNQAETFSKPAQTQITLMFNKLCQELIEADFALQMCIPHDNTPINERGKAFVNWVHGFLLGFGLHQNDLTQCSEDVKEALEDFSQIAKMDEAMEEGEASEQAFFEVLEYVRISAMLCFNELGKSLIHAKPKGPVLH
jgi:yecA family protein